MTNTTTTLEDRLESAERTLAAGGVELSSIRDFPTIELLVAHSEKQAAEIRQRAGADAHPPKPKGLFQRAGVAASAVTTPPALAKVAPPAALASANATFAEWNRLKKSSPQAAQSFFRLHRKELFSFAAEVRATEARAASASARVKVAANTVSRQQAPASGKEKFEEWQRLKKVDPPAAQSYFRQHQAEMRAYSRSLN